MPGFSNLPGTVSPDEVDSRSEWVPSGGGFARSLAARLGSETDAGKLTLAGLAPLRPHVAPDTWEALLEELPFPLRGPLRAPEAHLGPVPRLDTRAELVAFFARHSQHPDARALLYLAALYGALRASAPAALGEAVARELPPELAALWGSR